MLRDDGENVARFEPLLIGQTSPHRAGLNDLALELATRSASLSAKLPPPMARAAAELVRSMNCYYSNLIEGHDTHPVDIERALAGDYSADPGKRELQLEAKAHITVQEWIDDDGMSEHPTHPASIMELHRRFCELLPADLLHVEDPRNGTRLPVVPGELRTSYVEVGRHVCVSPGAVPRFMARFHQVYANTKGMDAILAAASAHHRLLWIHPFLDGNGRVARLMSYGMLRQSLDTGGLWSVARGLGRSVQQYKAHLQSCDTGRLGDLDGRGNLSESALAAFSAFFLRVCIDQVEFMAGLMQPDRLTDRVLLWAREQILAAALPPKSDVVLKALLYRGMLERGEIAGLLNVSERSARRITSALLESGAVKSESTRAPLHLAFPAKYADRWVPGLFPEQ